VLAAMFTQGAPQILSKRYSCTAALVVADLFCAAWENDEQEYALGV